MQVPFYADANANVCTCNVYACDAWICPSMMVQMEIVCFANILQKDAYVNVMHVMQMFDQYSWKFKNSL